MNIFRQNVNCDKMFSKDIIQKRVIELGEQITKEYLNKETLVVLGLADGGLMFAMDLIRKIKLPLEYYTCIIKSYGNTYQSSGEPTHFYFPECDLNNKNVLIVDDIKDSGNTLNYVKQHIKKTFNSVKSIECCVLVENISKENDIKPKYTALETKGEWIFGYGLDDEGLYRNINNIVFKRIK